ncbi:MAG: 50S ribosome-binding GTPase [Xenococcus sp. MO_188.B8]|nr:50S ribosome-binding GTPase [Xenococcus sp. MO_188.B8]
MTIPEYKITVLGPSGVGKTSLLTAMYEKFEDTAGKLQMTIDPNNETSIIIAECLEKLEYLTRQSNKIRITPGEGIRGTDDPFSFYFDLCQTGKPPSLRLHFQDYPGGWISTTERVNEVVNFVRESVAVLIPIDATAFMEKGGRYHKEINQPSRVTDVIKKAYQNLDSPRLVILAPIKCETYLGEGNNIEKVKTLFECVDRTYYRLINLLKAESLFSKVAVVKIPIQTIGSVILSTVDDEDERNPIFYFRKKQPDATYAPQDSEQPVKYLLQFILKLHQERRHPLVKKIRQWLDLDKSFQEVATRFAKETYSHNCRITQGHKWLDI